MTTRQQIIAAAVNTVEELRNELVPRDTGNMARNALQYKISDNEIVIYIDTKVAPYVYYTNEPWISPRWNGKKNPNQDWWDVFAQTFIERFNDKLGGTIK